MSFRYSAVFTEVFDFHQLQVVHDWFLEHGGIRGWQWDWLRNPWEIYGVQACDPELFTLYNLQHEQIFRIPRES